MKKIVILSVLGTLLVVGSVVGTLFATGSLPGLTPSPELTGTESDIEASDAVAVRAASAYVPLDPAFVATFANPSVAQFLQVSIEVAVDGKSAEDAIKRHGPVIRNSIVMVLSRQSAEELQTPKGKEQLRAQIRDEIRDTLSGLTGKSGVVDVYFTSFLMQ
ncbi:flagellar basal body-associated FliL family protein [Thioalkalicoccus limnaeus]|uniref:Flagellar protein FliL n=1 Tax=Thioalkalicoccus limnaeus TaxID=120681 RepID=A0ABV4BBP4_9GAMM